MKNTDSTRDTTTDHSSPSNPTSRAAGPSYGFPSLVAAIFGVTISCILAGGGFSMIGLFIGLPSMFVMCGIYNMYVMPRVARLVPPRPKPGVIIRTRHRFHSALRGLTLGYAAAAVLWLVIHLTSNYTPSTSQHGPGESLPVILLGGLITFVLTFFLARYTQLRGIENWQRFYGIGDTD